jgi:hypothetical protein
MGDAANPDSVWGRVDEEQPVVANTQPQFLPLSLERLHIPGGRFGEAVEGGENTRGAGLVESVISALAASVHTRRFTPGPDSCRFLAQ